MAFKLKSDTTTGVQNKQYFWNIMAMGAGVQMWGYLTADPAATVDGSGYITAEELIATLNVGDLIWVWVADAISDANNHQQDMAAGMADLSLHMVLENTGTVVDLSPDLLGTNQLSYGD